ncbi:hypothetical protein BL250_15485 [Erwinia sp. OLTSP20]|uniref:ANR family transcriptional regulator n=1 Tax=unclassified Erwinia TaxID=2622719 RepID=UPI000C19C657|nr:MULTISPECIES: ANR family transcriptional regulator [unclassified Erwinia]PIJ48610.1 hypothetical protein BV501_16505 [Erwinia sp. OAMSP11]PIJ68964.1 hypothetical protein BK416_15745 [Erwinia sp. OLSSP12]PIJ78822.1 hypothetical protein BLD47_16510 [Erwinia sp. OLCASP19]PIJ79928.1 hypothetical protein BLD46_16395 [Erwinia sp. OLMTSP26]PIJ82046.1 hypothetical protein BLD49_15910 [Erwinia sp. OLMDSP33]
MEETENIQHNDHNTAPGGEGEAALSGYLRAPTQYDQWQAACWQAARLERGGEYAEAGARWLKALSLSRTGADRHWCESRA